MKKMIAAAAFGLAFTTVIGMGTTAQAAADKVVVAVDDDSFTIRPWGNDSSVRDWTENTIWAHLCYRPFTGAMLEAGELQMYAAKSVTKVDDATYDVEIYDNIVDSKGNAITAEDVVFSYDNWKLQVSARLTNSSSISISIVSPSGKTLSVTQGTYLV